MVSASIFAPVESPYDHTTDALWTLWKIHDRVLSSAVLSGTFADKGGYHNKRENLPSTDYSTGRDVRNDRYGPEDVSCGLDVSMSEAQMIQVTTRLWNAAQNNDPRLKWNGEYILREFIGTKNGTTVHCWVFTGGVPLGVGADQGSDPGRAKTHLWHVHYSVIRKFITIMGAMQQIGSIAVGETLADWKERTEVADYTEAQMRAFTWQFAGNPFPPNLSAAAMFTSMYTTIQTIAQKVDIDQTELEAIEAAAREGAMQSAQGIIDAVLAGLPEGTLTKDDVKASLREVLIEGVVPESQG